METTYVIAGIVGLYGLAKFTHFWQAETHDPTRIHYEAAGKKRTVESSAHTKKLHGDHAINVQSKNGKAFTRNSRVPYKGSDGFTYSDVYRTH